MPTSIWKAAATCPEIGNSSASRPPISEVLALANSRRSNAAANRGAWDRSSCAPLRGRMRRGLRRVPVNGCVRNVNDEPLPKRLRRWFGRLRCVRECELGPTGTQELFGRKRQGARPAIETYIREVEPSLHRFAGNRVLDRHNKLRKRNAARVLLNRDDCERTGGVTVGAQVGYAVGGELHAEQGQDFRTTERLRFALREPNPNGCGNRCVVAKWFLRVGQTDRADRDEPSRRPDHGPAHNEPKDASARPAPCASMQRRAASQSPALA